MFDILSDSFFIAAAALAVVELRPEQMHLENILSFLCWALSVVLN